MTQKKQSTSTNLSKKVMQQIEKEDIKIKPRIWFALGNLLIAIGVIFTVFVGIFFFNLIVFKFRSLSDSGCLCWNNLLTNFWQEFPWLSILIAILSLCLGFYLLHKFQFVYSKNKFFIILPIIILSGILAIGIDKTGINEKLLHSPIFPAYCTLGKSHCELNENNQCRPKNLTNEYQNCGCNQDK